jgi:hypothetical protein|tara:strand:- start:145 stop:333 length:189 start_codon:yes stop_codon:yes gene_type:complete
MLSIEKGNRYVISKQLFDTHTGSMIPTGTSIKVDEVLDTGAVRVTDGAGRVLWVKLSDISVY